MNSRDGLHGLVQGFEHLLMHYQFHGTGSYNTFDFDLYKFVGHELMAVLAAHLIRAERWEQFPPLFAETVHYDGPRNYPVNVDRVCDTVVLLDRLKAEKRRISVHADLLSERHERVPPLADVPFRELIAGDLMLRLGLAAWFPWSAVYIADKIPRFLSATVTVKGSQALATALGIPDLDAMKAKVTMSIGSLQRNLGNGGAWRSWDFDPGKIATS